MIRVFFLIFCLVCTAMGFENDSKSVPKRRRQASDFVYPYFEVSAGVQRAKSDYKTESYSHWYHDVDREEMIYDEDLYYDVYSFEGHGPFFNSRVGALVFRRLAVFFDIGFIRSAGNSSYKYYSRDKEEFKENGNVVRFFWGGGVKVFPFVNVSSIFDGLFVGTALSFMDVDNSWKEYEMTYTDYEFGLRIETGNLWKIYKHFFLGITLNAALYWNAAETENEYKIAQFRVGESPNRAPAGGIHSLQFGAALSVVHK